MVTGGVENRPSLGGVNRVGIGGEEKKFGVQNAGHDLQ